MGAGDDSKRRCGLRAGVALSLLLGIAEAQAARLIAAKGTEPAGYGRIALTFDKAVSVKARLAGTVLVLTYGERVASGPEHLTDEMPSYVATVRRDPDGGGLRIALPKPYRVNLQEAGEKVFVDLLPEGWTGLVPPLPPDVVADLARRAQAAEAALKLRAPPPIRRPLAVELATLPTLLRLSLRLPPGTDTTTVVEGPATRLRVSGAWTIDANETRGRTKPALATLATETDDASASLVLTPTDGYVVLAEREDDTLTLDVVRKPAPGPKPEPEAARRAA
ncbi:hypothetical protein ACFQ12_19330, partial [Methylobacterium trifolii]